MAKNLIKGFAIPEEQKEKEKRKFVIPKKYIPKPDVFYVEVLPCDDLLWYFGLTGKTIRVQESCETHYKALDYQDLGTPFITKIIEKIDCKIVEHDSTSRV